MDNANLTPAQQAQLQTNGFVVLPNLIPQEQLPTLQHAYDQAMADSQPPHLKIGSATTRLSHLLYHNPAFEPLIRAEQILAAAALVIGKPFKLSSLLARTLRPHTPAQPLHADLDPTSDAYPMLGFIYMVDAFTPHNGATRFQPDPTGPEQQACGEAGAAILFNASTLHGHAANTTGSPRRSIQGYYIPSTATAVEQARSWS